MIFARFGSVGAVFGVLKTHSLASQSAVPSWLLALGGVGMARGLKALNLQLIKEIVITWIVTIPLCAIFSIAAFYFLKLCFL